ncbi:acetyl-CoA carboxylase biotin carboxyl carrier protein [Amphibacillus marinus]|uniref:Biotin carboxyl carrier protein of acetyl-CoA carboxylase n=1 Tax=Amphibacillus marinus TaxID=872970 RepID=A0A1H8NL79_9BACI|nr:acetyl-CoA carboxylase biotin carboxyl carrier protein [Amphibacillus marinus]SEO30374.1 acetyl-CoA carboxylase biotin carboxyl carrier protein [Amphibacillus marinus]
MIKISEIKELIKVLDASSVDELVYEFENEKLKLKKNVPTFESVPVQTAQPIVTPAIELADDKQPVTVEKVQPDYDYEITSPMVGTFYLSSSPETGPYVKIGDQVTKKSVVCIVEAMKLFNEIEAEVDGEVVTILAENGELVEYGQPLFGIKQK